MLAQFGGDPRAPLAASSILVVDDDRDAAVLMRDLLRKRGYRSECVYSAEEGLGQLATSAVDIVVTDVAMSGMSGIELCRHVHDAHPEIGSIVVSGYTSAEVTAEAMQSGAYEVIAKPLHAEPFCIAVARTLEHVSLVRELEWLRGDAGVVGHLTETDGLHEYVTLDEMQRRYIREVLAVVGGNAREAARVLGIDRRSLFRRIGLVRPSPAR